MKSRVANQKNLLVIYCLSIWPLTQKNTICNCSIIYPSMYHKSSGRKSVSCNHHKLKSCFDNTLYTQHHRCQSSFYLNIIFEIAIERKHIVEIYTPTVTTNIRTLVQIQSRLGVAIGFNGPMTIRRIQIFTPVFNRSGILQWSDWTVQVSNKFRTLVKFVKFLQITFSQCIRPFNERRIIYL